MSEETKIQLAAFTDEQLSEELDRRRKQNRENELKNLNINGITSKDFIVKYYDEGEYGYRYQFYLIHDQKEYCIYYDYNRGQPQKWWPTRKSDYSS